MPELKVLLLSGTTEGRTLARSALPPGVRVISSLAGRTHAPLLPHGPVRVGGFGGVPGLIAYLRSEGIGAIVDATHAFASTMTGNAVAASSATGVPLLVLRRPGWSEQPGDTWHRVLSMAAAAELVPALGERIFLTTGRQTIAAFAGVDQCWFLARSVEPPTPPMPARLSVILDRGPFTVDGERALMTGHRIEALVTKDSGGATAKLDAARELGVPVILINRPPHPAAPTVTTVEEALTWLTTLAASQADSQMQS